MNIKAFKYLLWFLLLVPVHAQNIVPISDLRNNNANGVPIDTGQIFTVKGVVTSSNHFGTAGPGSIQDGTAAISVYGTSFASIVTIGDTVQVTSKLTHFNGLTQFDLRVSGSSFIKLGHGTNPEPEVLSIGEIITQNWNGYEAHESKLIRINNVTISGSGNFAASTNYTISDTSGTMQLRIDDNVSSIIGTPIPQGQIDLVGILGQYKNSAPYSSGYQLLPRNIADIVVDGRPLIYNSVYASNIDTNSFKVYFETARRGNSQVKFGLTPSLELDSVVIEDDTTHHVVPVTGLMENTVYYYKAYSRNQAGESSSNLYSLRTASSNPSLGNIFVYFNNSIDSSVAIPGNKALGNVNFLEKVIEKINSATYSIDIAAYSFNGLNDMALALVNAKNRGVKVRLVYENRTMQGNVQTLLNAGIKMSQRPSSLSGIMHNKFIVFDGRDSDPTNDWVWTGSWNFTSTELTWKNNVIVVNDPSLAAAYTAEFEEMWGSNNDIPNPANARFGSQKLDNTPHSFSIGGRPVFLYFSPSDLTSSRIISTVSSAHHSIYFALYSFTYDDLGTIIKNRNIAGVTDIKGVIDQANANGSEYNFLRTFADVWSNPTGLVLHHKYAVIDASYQGSEPVIVTGSHNWSSSAENDNDENTVIIKDLYIANQFMQEFKKRYNEVGGTGTFVIPVVGLEEEKSLFTSHQLFQNYPNPFNPTTTIRIQVKTTGHLTLEVFDILGKKVATLFDAVAQPGIIAVDVNSRQFNNGGVSGVYFYRLSGNGINETRKMMILE